MPAVGELLRDLDDHPAVGVTTEVAEHVVEGHPPAKNLPGGHGRIEASGQERYGAALRAEGKPARPRAPRREQVR